MRTPSLPETSHLIPKLNASRRRQLMRQFVAGVVVALSAVTTGVGLGASTATTACNQTPAQVATDVKTALSAADILCLAAEVALPDVQALKNCNLLDPATYAVTAGDAGIPRSDREAAALAALTQLRADQPAPKGLCAPASGK